MYYLNFNSLYATLHIHLTSWEMDEFLKIGIVNYTTDGDAGYWLHVNTSEYFVIFTHMKITKDMLSPHSQRLLVGEGCKFAK